MSIEKMEDFFTARVEGYDEHMINNVQGCRNGYTKMAELIPLCTQSLLDLGCGTGLELEEIYNVLPEVEVTGIDLTKAMLDQLRCKYSNKNINLIHANYLEYDFGSSTYDIAISFQTMHHFSHNDKIELYTKIFQALNNNGQYIECDYMVIEQEEEDFYYAENRRIRSEQGILDGEFYHYDTPCTIQNQKNMLLASGFKSVDFLWREGNTTILVAKK